MLPRLIPFRLRPALELWGGVECTFNRVGEEYFDQFRWSAHDARLDDLDAIAELGIATLRYPVLWERVAPHHPDEHDWSFSDERLKRLSELEITPIAGLVHHGSGPRYTNLLDPCFPEKLAAYARAVATRYPHLEYYTPVNEPLTTARFSALYGHWYPHKCDPLSFVRALLNQIRGTMLAMREIRRINPNAKLVQTEDMGRVWSTPSLAYQADFENERRWLSFDLLCGRVDENHRMARFFARRGLQDEEFLPLLETPCPPDIMGLNYYLTSERFLDERWRRYPAEARGGNGKQEYADVAAVRVCSTGIADAGAILNEAWKRYGLPLAITEAHLGCTREEQARWLVEVWNEAKSARRAGADVRAVTVWSLLGAYNWNSLVTRDDNCYEAGVFDLRSGQLHPTLLTKIVRDLADGRLPQHPVLDSPGWWRQPTRLQFPARQPNQKKGFELHQRFRSRPNTKVQNTILSLANKTAQPILISGATGTLGYAFSDACRNRHLPHQLSNRRQMDIADAASVSAALDKWQPWAVVNTAGYVRVDDAENDAENCFRENTGGAAILARECATRGILLVTFSSDLVFDGKGSTPFLESDAPRPLNVYGRSKAEAEKQVLAFHPGALIVRTSAFFGPFDEYNFATVALKTIRARERFITVNDAVISPTYVPDLANMSLDLLMDGASGIWHLANESAVTWEQFAHQVAEMAGEDTSFIEGRSTAEMNWPAARPRYSVLSSERTLGLPPLEDALARYFKERAAYLKYSLQAAEAAVERVRVASSG